jgi:transcriptional regulator with XRE-family HTH domain
MSLPQNEFIRLLRESRGFCQVFIAEKIGISANAYSKFEKGEIRFKEERFKAIVEILTLPPLPSSCKAFLGGSFMLKEPKNQAWLPDVLDVIRDNGALSDIKDMVEGRFDASRPEK